MATLKIPPDLRSIKPRCLNKNQAGRYLGVSRRTIERYIESQQLKTCRIEAPGNPSEYLDKILIPIESLDALYERRLEL